LCEDEDLATVGWVGHRLGITDKRSGEDGFSRDVGLGSERLAFKDGAVLNSCQCHAKICIMTLRTLMVKVAGSLETAVALRMLGVGITRCVFPSTVARQRACTRFFVIRPRNPADRMVEGLIICDNMMSGDRE
jgi:hypothetical protein